MTDKIIPTHTFTMPEQQEYKLEFKKIEIDCEKHYITDNILYIVDHNGITNNFCCLCFKEKLEELGLKSYEVID